VVTQSATFLAVHFRAADQNRCRWSW